jgi:hypothetical protein
MTSSVCERRSAPAFLIVRLTGSMGCWRRASCSFLPEPAYVFKHAVIQDVAHESLLVQRRPRRRTPSNYRQLLFFVQHAGEAPSIPSTTRPTPRQLSSHAWRATRAGATGAKWRKPRAAVSRLRRRSIGWAAFAQSTDMNRFRSCCASCSVASVPRFSRSSNISRMLSCIEINCLRERGFADRCRSGR